MSCPDTKACSAATQGGSSGAPVYSKHYYKSPETAFRAAKRRKKADNDTRAAACRNPKIAYSYALEIDRSPHDDTRAAACQEPMRAYAYARDVDQGFHPETLSAVLGTVYYQAYLNHFGMQIDELELRILLGVPYDTEELLARPDLIAKYGL